LVFPLLPGRCRDCGRDLLVQPCVQLETSLLFVPAIYLIYRSYRLYLGKLEDEKRHVEEIANLHLRTIEALALAIEAKDQTTHDHLQRVRVYAIEVAKELGIKGAELEALHAAALLHDIGKLAVPEHIISKPGRLTPEEFEKMKIHTVVGAEILERVRFPYPVVPIVRAHHENGDGSGYPYGLKGMEIPIGARILSAVDYLDALASDRQYRRAMPLDEVMQRLLESRASRSIRRWWRFSRIATALWKISRVRNRHKTVTWRSRRSSRLHAARPRLPDSKTRPLPIPRARNNLSILDCGRPAGGPVLV